MIIITDNQQLNNLYEKLLSEDFIGVDTEFLRTKTYYPKLCLLQIATKDAIYLIDPLNDQLDLTIILPIFNNMKVLKIFHSARQDIEILFKLTTQIVSPIFDTQLGAMICGYGESLSYDKLVKQLCNQQLAKDSQFTDWSIRPLSESQLNYASLDVAYLLKLYNVLVRKINSLNLGDLYQQLLVNLIDKKKYLNLPEEAWSKIKSKNESIKQLPLTKELAAWREDMAKKLNIPRNHVLDEKILLAIVINPPNDISQLIKLARINNSRLKNELAKQIINIISKAATKIDLINSQLIINKPLLTILKLIISFKAREYNIAESAIISGAELKELATENLPIARKNQILSSKRLQIFGQEYNNLIDGKLAIKLNNQLNLTLIKLDK